MIWDEHEWIRPDAPTVFSGNPLRKRKPIGFERKHDIEIFDKIAAEEAKDFTDMMQAKAGGEYLW